MFSFYAHKLPLLVNHLFRVCCPNNMLHLQHIYANIIIVKNQVLGEDYIMKRFIALAILASLTVAHTIPVLAIEDTKIDYKQIKTEKIKPTQNKYDYINLSWWQSFNDEFLNGYIIKAVENNKLNFMTKINILVYKNFMMIYKQLILKNALEQI